jgi:hypothetical protein
VLKRETGYGAIYDERGKQNRPSRENGVRGKAFELVFLQWKAENRKRETENRKKKR